MQQLRGGARSGLRLCGREHEGDLTASWLVKVSEQIENRGPIISMTTIYLVERMRKELESQFLKSKSRYQFNIDRIAEKYCGSNKRDLALEALQRNFGEACISSPIIGLKDKSYKAICRHLNKVRILVIEIRAKVLLKITENLEAIPVKRLRVGPSSCRVIDVITSPIKEGPYELCTMANSALDLYDAQSSSNMERFTITKNGKFLEAWFSNAQRYWTNTNFVRDHSLRWRTAYNARRNTHHNLGYVNMSDH
ncbi:unnamed protein product [Onchocerca flexuosa]|uniref:CDAN1-interacting nuclease 1 n=1 Tax=Onchocerca flexuosa TaxID=387005 RepID=A0A183HZ12_9BILA|nr:unnamed protein product [Onchocerca flexuosa]